MAVGGQRDVEGLAAVLVWRAELREVANEIHYAFAQKRLAAGEAYLGDAHPNQHARHAQIVGERQVAIERALIAGAAIDTLVVAAVGDGDPQVGDGAAEFVSKRHDRLVTL